MLFNIESVYPVTIIIIYCLFSNTVICTGLNISHLDFKPSKLKRYVNLFIFIVLYYKALSLNMKTKLNVYIYLRSWRKYVSSLYGGDSECFFIDHSQHKI